MNTHAMVLRPRKRGNQGQASLRDTNQIYTKIKNRHDTHHQKRKDNHARLESSNAPRTRAHSKIVVEMVDQAQKKLAEMRRIQRHAKENQRVLTLEMQRAHTVSQSWVLATAVSGGLLLAGFFVPVAAPFANPTFVYGYVFVPVQKTLEQLGLKQGAPVALVELLVGLGATGGVNFLGLVFMPFMPGSSLILGTVAATLVVEIGRQGVTYQINKWKMFLNPEGVRQYDYKQKEWKAQEEQKERQIEFRTLQELLMHQSLQDYKKSKDTWVGKIKKVNTLLSVRWRFDIMWYATLLAKLSTAIASAFLMQHLKETLMNFYNAGLGFLGSWTQWLTGQDASGILSHWMMRQPVEHWFHNFAPKAIQVVKQMMMPFVTPLLSEKLQTVYDWSIHRLYEAFVVTSQYYNNIPVVLSVRRYMSAHGMSFASALVVTNAGLLALGLPLVPFGTGLVGLVLAVGVMEAYLQPPQWLGSLQAMFNQTPVSGILESACRSSFVQLGLLASNQAISVLQETPSSEWVASGVRILQDSSLVQMHPDTFLGKLLIAPFQEGTSIRMDGQLWKLLSVGDPQKILLESAGGGSRMLSVLDPVDFLALKKATTSMGFPLSLATPLQALEQSLAERYATQVPDQADVLLDFTRKVLQKATPEALKDIQEIDKTLKLFAQKQDDYKKVIEQAKSNLETRQNQLKEVEWWGPGRQDLQFDDREKTFEVFAALTGTAAPETAGTKVVSAELLARIGNLSPEFWSLTSTSEVFRLFLAGGAPPPAGEGLRWQALYEQYRQATLDAPPLNLVDATSVYHATLRDLEKQNLPMNQLVPQLENLKRWYDVSRLQDVQETFADDMTRIHQSQHGLETTIANLVHHLKNAGAEVEENKTFPILNPLPAQPVSFSRPGIPPAMASAAEISPLLEKFVKDLPGTTVQNTHLGSTLQVPAVKTPTVISKILDLSQQVKERGTAEDIKTGDILQTLSESLSTRQALSLDAATGVALQDLQDKITSSTPPELAVLKAPTDRSLDETQAACFYSKNAATNPACFMTAFGPDLLFGKADPRLAKQIGSQVNTNIDMNAPLDAKSTILSKSGMRFLAETTGATATTVKSGAMIGGKLGAVAGPAGAAIGGKVGAVAGVVTGAGGYIYQQVNEVVDYSKDVYEQTRNMVFDGEATQKFLDATEKDGEMRIFGELMATMHLQEAFENLKEGEPIPEVLRIASQKWFPVLGLPEIPVEWTAGKEANPVPMKAFIFSVNSLQAVMSLMKEVKGEGGDAKEFIAKVGSLLGGGPDPYKEMRGGEGVWGWLSETTASILSTKDTVASATYAVYLGTWGFTDLVNLLDRQQTSVITALLGDAQTSLPRQKFDVFSKLYTKRGLSAAEAYMAAADRMLQFLGNP